MSLMYNEWNKAVAAFQLSNYLYMLRTEKQRVLCLLWTEHLLVYPTKQISGT